MGQRRFARGAGVRCASYGEGVLPTWPVNANVVYWMALGHRAPDLGWINDVATFNRYFGIGIDHTYVSDRVGVVDFQHGPPLGSDHLPHYSDLYVNAHAPI